MYKLSASDRLATGCCFKRGSLLVVRNVLISLEEFEILFHANILLFYAYI